MTYSVLTLFPEAFTSTLNTSILKRAQQEQKIKIDLYQLRQWSIDQRGTVDDKPFGGGAGMILRVEPIFNAVRAIDPNHQARLILLSPQGQLLNQEKAQALSQQDHLLLICGHYEGVDERVRTHLIDEEISIGNYVLMGGELPALVLIEATARLRPGILGSSASFLEESFNLKNEQGQPILEYPQYTKPREFQGLKVPEVLLSGNHQAITHWRQQQALGKTQKQRPELLRNR